MTADTGEKKHRKFIWFLDKGGSENPQPPHYREKYLVRYELIDIQQSSINVSGSAEKDNWINGHIYLGRITAQKLFNKSATNHKLVNRKWSGSKIYNKLNSTRSDYNARLTFT